MSIESNKRKAELQREIIIQKLMYDGRDLDHLTIEQLKKVLELQKAVSDYVAEVISK